MILEPAVVYHPTPFSFFPLYSLQVPTHPERLNWEIPTYRYHDSARNLACWCAWFCFAAWKLEIKYTRDVGMSRLNLPQQPSPARISIGWLASIKVLML
jgi:hypothetical protein